MRYLPDTNACIALLNGRPPAVDARFRRALKSGADVALSAIVLAELWYGVVRSARTDENAERLRTFSAGPLPVVAFDDNDARVAGEIRGELAAHGIPLGPYDALIAAQALQRNVTLVTANVESLREFMNCAGRIGLRSSGELGTPPRKCRAAQAEARSRSPAVSSPARI